MVKVLIGDLFESKAQTLVNTVNTVGVMGKGVALEFRERFPDMYDDYVARCKAGQVKLGQPYLFLRLIPPWILNFPTKEHWRSVARLSDIVRGLEYLERRYHEWGITSLAVPPLGCGEGQLEWRIVGPTLYRHLSRLSIPVELYAPHGTPSEELDVAFLMEQPVAAASGSVGRPLRVQPGSVALVDILARIEREPYHWPIGRTTFQKIAYFATETGLHTGLKYERGSYGPFAYELKRLITSLVNNGLIREEQLGRMFAVKVGPTYEDARRAYRQDLSHWRPLIERIADLFLRMRTTEAEVAATVHFAAMSLARSMHDKPSEKEVLADVLRWKQRRRPPLSEMEIARTIRSLAALGWLDVKPSPDLPVPEEVGVDV
jgi:O-acetyl-ADP-ribose deacetylase (regulator of RNase III)/uncharacterized protein YwgA